MKAITLRHPWAFAVAFAGKDVENRDWDDRLADLMGLPAFIGSEIAIHGGSAPKRGKNKGWLELTDGIRAIHGMTGGNLPNTAAQYLARQPGPLCAEHFITPGIVALATLTGARRGSESSWAVPGQLHLELSNVRPLSQAVLCPGAQGFWTLPPDLEEIVERRAAAPAGKWGALDAAEWLR